MVGKMNRWKIVAITGWTLFFLLSGWHFVIEPLQVKIDGLINVVQQIVNQRQQKQAVVVPDVTPP